MKIALVTSRGGHLFQLYQLKNWWQKYDHFWVTFPGGDTNFLLKREKIYYAYYPESRHFLNALRNFFLAFHIIFKENPDLLVSTGAAIAPPVFLAAKLLRKRVIFIEPYDFVKHQSLSGRLVYHLADKFLIQNKYLKKFYPKAEYWGATI
ncbi:MAG: PssD/Cps14F family polysaccharide biosynthesis glycosyltransferase [bacterium]|nr:PssD/Cps14F family polysaccharide biosynthesis glycosyltransferase [bacterium]